MTTKIIGIDCATDPQKVGLALGEYREKRASVHEIKKPAKGESVAETVMPWIDKDEQILLCIDAPLGWPLSLGTHLLTHNAGDYIGAESHSLFRRVTDQCVKELTGKQPLDVGADRIARTAHAALNILNDLREMTGEQIPLAWDRKLQSRISAIEIYPGATLRTSGIRSSGYKSPENRVERLDVLNGLQKFIEIDADILFPEEQRLHDIDNDMLDAMVCILAGADFLSGNVIPPGDFGVARKEGWIWFCPNRKLQDYGLGEIKRVDE